MMFGNVSAERKAKRDVAVSAVLQPNDSMEKLYMTVKIV